MRLAYAKSHKLPGLDYRERFVQAEAERLAELERIAGTR
jgi:hypothetical protein